MKTPKFKVGQVVGFVLYGTLDAVGKILSVFEENGAIFYQIERWVRPEAMLRVLTPEECGLAASLPGDQKGAI